MAFSSRSVSAAVTSALLLLGYSQLKAEQKQVVEAFVAGRDVFLSLPTGSVTLFCPTSSIVYANCCGAAHRPLFCVREMGHVRSFCPRTTTIVDPKKWYPFQHAGAAGATVGRVFGVCVDCDVGPSWSRETTLVGRGRAPVGMRRGMYRCCRLMGALCPFEVEALPCGKQADLPGEGQAQEAPGILER